MVSANKGRSNIRPRRIGATGKNPALAALRRFKDKEFTRILDLVLTSNFDELKAVALDPESSCLKAGIARALLRACQKGDWKTLEGIVERVVGKVPQKHDHTSKGEKMNSGGGSSVVLYLPANGRTKEENIADDGAGF